MTEPNESDFACVNMLWNLAIVLDKARIVATHRIAAEERVRGEMTEIIDLHNQAMGVQTTLIDSLNTQLADERCCRAEQARDYVSDTAHYLDKIESLTDALELMTLRKDDLRSALAEERNSHGITKADKRRLKEMAGDAWKQRDKELVEHRAERDALAAKLEQQLKEFRVLDDARDDVIDDWRTTAENKQRVIEKLRTELTAANQDREDVRKIIDAYQQQTEQPATPRPFRVGDRVRCVDDGKLSNGSECCGISLGEYTVARVYDLGTGPQLTLQELPTSGSFFASRFVHAEADFDNAALHDCSHGGPMDIPNTGAAWCGRCGAYRAEINGPWSPSLNEAVNEGLRRSVDYAEKRANIMRETIGDAIELLRGAK